MNDKFKVCRRIFFVWQAEKEEKWLRMKALKGWHLVNTEFCTYYFEKGESRDVIYKLDFKNSGDKDLGDYKEIFEDAGWEYVSRMNGWHYFRVEAKKNKVHEIYTDNESRLMKYRSLLKYLLLAGSPSVSAIFLFSVLFLLDHEDMSGPMIGMYILVITVAVLLGYSILRIWLLIRKVKEKSVE